MLHCGCLFVGGGICFLTFLLCMWKCEIKGWTHPQWMEVGFPPHPPTAFSRETKVKLFSWTWRHRLQLWKKKMAAVEISELDPSSLLLSAPQLCSPRLWWKTNKPVVQIYPFSTAELRIHRQPSGLNLSFTFRFLRMETSLNRLTKGKPSHHWAPFTGNSSFPVNQMFSHMCSRWFYAPIIQVIFVCFCQYLSPELETWVWDIHLWPSQHICSSMRKFRFLSLKVNTNTPSSSQLKPKNCIFKFLPTPSFTSL